MTDSCSIGGGPRAFSLKISVFLSFIGLFSFLRLVTEKSGASLEARQIECYTTEVLKTSFMFDILCNIMVYCFTSNLRRDAKLIKFQSTTVFELTLWAQFRLEQADSLQSYFLFLTELPASTFRSHTF